MFQVRRQRQYFDDTGPHVEDEPVKGGLDYEIAVRMAKLHNQNLSIVDTTKQRRFDDRLLKVTVYYVQPMKADGRKKK
tara:strand:- start:2285 stop:2518 length:234 start_codon:yes stop_codon:yes gene_type:complete